MAEELREGVDPAGPHAANSSAQMQAGRMMAAMTESTSDLVEVSALGLAGMIRERQVSAVEVIEAHLARIAERNELINAIVVVAHDAREQAIASDRSLGEGRPAGPFHGVPFTAKDSSRPPICPPRSPWRR